MMDGTREGLLGGGVSPSRPVLRWHGGKWLLAPWIIRHFPAHRTYVEPFGGAASVLLRKATSYAEVYNDLDAEVVTFFRTLRDPEAGPRLIEMLRWTPFARAEFEAAYEDTPDPVEASRRLMVRSFQGFGADGFNTAVRTGFRASSTRAGTTPTTDWSTYADAVDLVRQRIIGDGVTIEHRDALVVMASHDGPETLHYVDPPYLAETRSDKSRKGGGRYHAYRHELSDEDHDALLDALLGLQGRVVLSGYPSARYDAGLRGWRRVERRALADGARARTEVLWMNFDPPARQAEMFEVAA